MRDIIINADDFGMSTDHNEAIMATMGQNLCSETTLLVNFEASAEAAELAMKLKLTDRIGIHLNLTQGSPVSEGIKKESKFCNSQGLFCYRRDKRLFRLSKEEKKAVYDELVSQIKLFRKFGIPISHADSHNHVHEEPALFKVFTGALRAEKIPYIRPLFNMEKTAMQNTLYRFARNSYLFRKKLTGVEYFGTVNNFISFSERIRPGAKTEIMIHPAFIKEGEIYDSVSKGNLSQILPAIVSDNRLISYREV